MIDNLPITLAWSAGKSSFFSQLMKREEEKMRGGEKRGVELETIILGRQNNGILLQYTKCRARCVWPTVDAQKIKGIVVTKIII